MSDVQDLWLSAGPDGRDRPTKRHGRGVRWKARYIAPDGSEGSKCFARKTDAEQFLAIKEKARIRAELLASDGDGIDPNGFYVYLLWELEGDEAPVYVGASGNILSRLGTHLGGAAKRSRIGRITLIRCTSQKAMLRPEDELIRKYRPTWNKDIPLAEGGRERNGQAAAPGAAADPDREWHQLVRSVRQAGQRARQTALPPPRQRAAACPGTADGSP